MPSLAVNIPPETRKPKATDEDVSPGTIAPPGTTPDSYFPNQHGRLPDTTAPQPVGGSFSQAGQLAPSSDVAVNQLAEAPDKTAANKSLRTTVLLSPHVQSLQIDAKPSERKMSISSLTWRPPRNPSLPQGTQKRHDSLRIRRASPPPQRFSSHVAFDNLKGETTKSNTLGLTLNTRHRGYRPTRLSRTFMAGVDESTQSLHALQYLLDKLVDDGDEIVCVRVNEKDVKPNQQKLYQTEATDLLESITKMNTDHRSVSIVLEYQFGKLSTTILRLIQVYQPAMLVVGTKGKSGQGLQGMWNTRNSFSKYCLQYSPVPVVVVRPTEKREKKKEKRALDPSRQSYAQVLAATGGQHESQVDTTGMYELEEQISADEEAHRVAQALALPAAYDPTIKGIDVATMFSQRSHATATSEPASRTKRPEGPNGENGVESDDDDDDDDEDDDDEDEEHTGSPQVVRSHALQESKNKKLHEMEAGEAAALRKKEMDVDDDD